MSSTVSDPSTVYIAWAQDTTRKFLFYATLIVTPIGLLFNAIQTVVFLRKKFHNTTMGFFYITLAFFDCLALIILFCEYFSVAVNSDLQLKSSASCIVVIYLIRVSVHIPSWIQVMITYDRFLSVVYPNRFKFNKNKRTLAVIILGIIVSIMVINAENFWFGVQETVTYQNVTTFDANGTAIVSLKTTVTRACTSLKGIVLARDMVAATFRSILPFFFMFAGNCVLIKALIQSKKKSKVIKQNKSIASAMKKEVQFTISIFAMNLLFMVVYLPLTITLYLSGILTYFPNLASASFKAGNALAFNISVYVAFMNNSLPLVINLCFNKIFRSEFMRLIHKIKNEKFGATSVASSNLN